MRARRATEWAEVAWINEGVGRRKRAADFPATQAELLRIHMSYELGRIRQEEGPELIAPASSYRYPISSYRRLNRLLAF
jgi:hypothetical protein